MGANGDRYSSAVVDMVYGVDMMACRTELGLSSMCAHGKGPVAVAVAVAGRVSNRKRSQLRQFQGG